MAIQCSICGEVFVSASDLRKHMREHTEERLFTCKICDKSFSLKCNLISHQRTHTGVRPFKCNKCNKDFKHAHSLTNHQRTHTDERPFKCDKCQKDFRHGHHLKDHQRTHTRERPFICKICDKSFSQQGTLTRHQRTHTGERPFKCDKCNKGFTRVHHLKYHQRTHTREMPFKCDKCHKAFRHSYSLTQHKRKHTERQNICKESSESFVVIPEFQQPNTLEKSLPETNTRSTIINSNANSQIQNVSLFENTYEYQKSKTFEDCLSESNTRSTKTDVNSQIQNVSLLENTNVQHPTSLLTQNEDNFSNVSSGLETNISVDDLLDLFPLIEETSGFSQKGDIFPPNYGIISPGKDRIIKTTEMNDETLLQYRTSQQNLLMNTSRIEEENQRIQSPLTYTNRELHEQSEFDLQFSLNTHHSVHENVSPLEITNEYQKSMLLEDSSSETNTTLTLTNTDAISHIQNIRLLENTHENQQSNTIEESLSEYQQWNTLETNIPIGDNFLELFPQIEETSGFLLTEDMELWNYFP